MLRLIKVLSLAVISSTLLAQEAAAPVPILPGDLKFQGSPALPGAESVWVIGGADKEGIYAQRVKLAKGAVINPHVHSDERFSVVLSGTIYVGFGEKLDETNVVAIPAGGVYIAPAGVPHYVWAKDGPAEYQESGVGPTKTTF
ncbi:MAG: cupin domain-containing protein, partial [Pseudomonadota bacterium]